MSTEPLRRRIDTDFDLNDPEINERWDDVISAMHQGDAPLPAARWARVTGSSIGMMMSPTP